MESKGSTDIDRKLAIYYHPLFQEAIKAVLDLFKTKGEKFEIGLLEFVQFNLKLQKALLPTFQIDNALVSGLNDWVKEVAECLTYEGMVSTSNCVEITPSTIRQVIESEMKGVYIQMFEQREKYIEQMVKISSHDAFKLLGVKINKQVFSKFMFDLCSTWCQFLDVELFSYFLIGLFMQISEGPTIHQSSFRQTSKISTIDLEFMEEFEDIKAQYNKTKKKELRYYRAWCEWNYLRVNEVGERLILKLDQLHVDDPRVLQLAVVFQNAIQIINEEITNQNPQKQADKGNQKKKDAKDSNEEPSDFLILKKLNIDTGNQGKQYVKPRNEEDSYYGGSQHESSIYHPKEDGQSQDFYIEIDEQGNMYLKRIIRMPVLGVKINPMPFESKIVAKRKALDMKKDEYREVSNLYRKMDPMKIRLEHNTKNDPYSVKPNPKLVQRDRFYENQPAAPESRKKDLDKTIHQKPFKPEQPKEDGEIVIPNIKKEAKASLREAKSYIHKVMAPSFLTDDNNNLSFAEKEGQIYSTTANNEKRELKIGLPKLKHMEFRVKPVKSYHIVGKLTSDRSLINEKVRSASISMAQNNDKSKLEIEMEQNKYIWSRYIDEEEMKELNNYKEFYAKLGEAKQKFGMEFQSEFRANLKPMLAYENKRYEMGGVLSKEDQQRFSERINRLINKQERRKNRKKRKQKLREFRKNFKSKQEKSLYEDIFLKYHKDAIKDIKMERKARNYSLASK